MSENRRNHYKSLLIVFLIFAVMFYIITTLPPFTTHTKHSEDYSAIDMLRAQKIVLGYTTPTKEMIDKYDINEDGEVTYTDVQIIQQMMCGFYDSYEVRSKNHIVIKYRN